MNIVAVNGDLLKQGKTTFEIQMGKSAFQRKIIVVVVKDDSMRLGIL